MNQPSPAHDHPSVVANDGSTIDINVDPARGAVVTAVSADGTEVAVVLTGQQLAYLSGTGVRLSIAAGAMGF